MRYLLFYLGRFFSILFSYRYYTKLLSGIEIIFTGWVTKGIKNLDVTSKIGFGVNIAGTNHIWIGSHSYLGRHSGITALPPPTTDKNKIIIYIGNNCRFGTDNHITAIAGIKIGNNLCTGKSVLISDNSHGDPRNKLQMDINPMLRPLTIKGTIEIGDH